MDAYSIFVRYALSEGVRQRGHHNDNFLVEPPERVALPLGLEPKVPVMLRRRHEGVPPVVLRTWQDESRILGAIKGWLECVPQCLVKQGDTAVHSYVDGVPLSTVCPNDVPLDDSLLQALAGLLSEMTAVHREHLPDLPRFWPRDGSSRAFLRTLADLTEEQVRKPNRPSFGGLFAALGVPEDAMPTFAERLPAMVGRPFSLLHTDLHRDNVIFSYFETVAPLICVDWELASYGDPLHDLATHLVRMRYPAEQWDDVKEAWVRAMEKVRPQAVTGLETDLPHYIDFERAQSVYPDVMRAAHSLGLGAEPVGLDAATEAVWQALDLARRPMRLRSVPRAAEVRSALYRWHSALTCRAPQVRFPVSTVDWRQPGLPYEAVMDALSKEGAAPAARVFKGTGHLNTVVRLSADAAPLIVRRRLSDSTRRERRFLEEHRVLRALEKGSGRVRAPRILAMGTSNPDDGFAIHSYVGPVDGIGSPQHPVNGLTPLEADDLVDQLCALAEVPTDSLSSGAGYDDFYQWLSDQLVEMVAGLPRESLRLAGVLGLPNASRLKELLKDGHVTSRTPVLLHGDLNPWNLISDAHAEHLTIIDWEMAMVGDPLYDLVRHLHLTPHRPGIRDRMFQRWAQQLGAYFTKDWEQDWQLYRRIETVRSAYVDLDRLVTGDSLDAPNVRRAVDSYSLTLSSAAAQLGLRPRIANPYLADALPGRERVAAQD